MDRNGPAPRKTGQTHVLGTHARTRNLTRTRARAERVYVKKLADARRGREWTRAMENRAEPRSRHTRTWTLTRTRERAERVHVKKLADARRGREWTRAMENW